VAVTAHFRVPQRRDHPRTAQETAQSGSFLGRLAARMLFVALLATVATASALLLYDRLQRSAEERIAAADTDSAGTAPRAAPRRTGLPQQPLQSKPKFEQPKPAPEEPKPAPEQPKPAPEQPKPAPEQPKTAPEQPKPAPQEPQPPPVVDPAKREAFRRAMTLARQAIGKRDFAGAKRHLKTAEANLQDAADEAELGRLELLLGNLEEFWRGMRRIVAGLVPAQEIMLGETPIIVVQVDANQLTVRSEGRNQSYRIFDLPRPIVEALAQSGFVKHPSTNVLLGAYMAMDPNGDRKRARQLWEQAARQGEDVRDLMAEIKDEGRGTRGKGREDGRQ
jgi:hypothetical protein